MNPSTNISTGSNASLINKRAAATVALCIAALVLFAAIVTTTPTALAANTPKTSQLAAPNSIAYGKSLTEWLSVYWEWYWSGADPAASKIGVVQLLALPAGEYISGAGSPSDPALFRGTLELTVPPGTPFVLPLFAWSSERYEGYPAVPDDVPIDTDVALGSGHPAFTIDGNVVLTDANKAAFFVPLTTFDPIVTYPEPTSYGAVGAVTFQGVGVVGTPLSAGKHVLHLYEPLILNPGDYPGLPDGVGVIFDNTWIITVK